MKRVCVAMVAIAVVVAASALWGNQRNGCMTRSELDAALANVAGDTPVVLQRGQEKRTCTMSAGDPCFCPIGGYTVEGLEGTQITVDELKAMLVVAADFLSRFGIGDDDTDVGYYWSSPNDDLLPTTGTALVDGAFVIYCAE